MGCSKPQTIPCPKAGPFTLVSCFGCQFHVIESNGTGSLYMPSIAKHIHEFTTDELLAEIRRRCGT